MLPDSSIDPMIVPDMVHQHATEQPHRAALIQDGRTLTYSALDTQMNRVAAALQAMNIQPTETIALCGLNSINYALVFFGALRAGVAAALIAPSSTRQAIAGMASDSGAKLICVDESQHTDIAATIGDIMPCISLGDTAIEAWLGSTSGTPEPVMIDPDWAFNIIYSSGTTGAPKGIVQSHSMRSEHVARAGVGFGYTENSVTMIATPLYSNTTLVSFIPAVALGGTAVLTGKFDAHSYVTLAAKHKATHAMLVPVQYKRIMALPDFDSFDLSSFQVKFCTSAPFSAELKANILARWPGGLVEFYGMTEGGGTCILVAHAHPDKLHTVGQPVEDHDIRLIDDHGNEVAPGEMGEIVGNSNAMMEGYHGQSAKTREAEWYDKTGKRFIRTGDVGRFDREGFLTLMDRKKDMIISGGFNVYPSDLEAELIKHAAIADVAVVGVPSEDWGETPIGFIVVKPGMQASADDIKSWLAARVGKTQRLSDVIFTDELPRSAIGKVLKRELRDAYAEG